MAKEHAKRKALSVKYRISTAFILFAIIVLIALWVLELACFDTLFAKYKQRLVEDDVVTVTKNINSDTLDVLIDHIARNRNACIAIIDSDGNIVYDSEARVSCLVHTYSVSTLKDLYQKIKSSDDSFSEVYPDIPYGDGYNKDNYEGSVPEKTAGLTDSVLCGKAVVTANGEVLVVLEDSALGAESAIKNAIAILLGIVSASAVIIAVVVGIKISRDVAKPIEDLSRLAGEITAGNADGTERINGRYREIEELSDALVSAGKEVSEVDRYRKELIANVGHDLRTPLTLIKGYSELMRDIPSEATAENLQVVIDESERLGNLVKDVLDLSKEQENADTLKLEKYDIVASLDELIARHSKLIEHLGYTIEWEHGKSANVYADEAKITQVIYNLINNAINYCGADKKVTVKEYVRGSNVRIEVIDKGEGIDVTVLPHIWDRYYKSDKSHKRATVGTGLGLSIVKSVMNRHPGGVYGVITSKGEGSTFYIELPRVL